MSNESPSARRASRKMAGAGSPEHARPAALDGIRVLDFTQMMLGPLATQLLSDLGADVIKVERPGSGEWMRGLPVGGGVLHEDSSAFLSMNRNKRSIAVDLKHPMAREVLLDIGRQCDVVAENFRPGVMDRLGLGYDDFRNIKSDIIYASGSGWGQNSELAKQNRPGQDLLVQAMCGVMFNTGRAVDPPTACGTPIADFAASQSLAAGILAALLARVRLGIGQRVEADLYSSVLAAQCQENFAVLNQDINLERSHSGIATTWNNAPYGAYATQDGWIAIAMTSLSKLGELVGDDTIGKLDPWNERDEIKTRIDAQMKSRTTSKWLKIFVAEDVWAAAIRTTKEAMSELEAMASDLLVTTVHPKAGPIKSIACSVGLSATPAVIRMPPPLVGQHTDEVIEELLGQGRAQALRAQGLFSDKN